MKGVLTILFFGLITISLFACELKSDIEATKEPKSKIGDNSTLYIENKDKVEEQFNKHEAIKMTIQHHNTTDEQIRGFKFLETMSENQIVSQKLDIGGKCCNTTQFDQMVEIEPDGKIYIVTLTENYNMTLDGKKMISYWKYEVSPNEVKLIEKVERGYAVTMIK